MPKTATHAVRKAMAVHLAPDDWQQQQLTRKQTLPISELARLGHGHISVQQLAPHAKAHKLHGYFTFAIVRNPFDRFVSCCAFLNRGNVAFTQDPLVWMKQALTRSRFKSRILVQPQIDMLCDEAGNPTVDYIGRYESLDQSVHHVFSHLKLPAPQLEHVNASAHRSYTDYYDDELRQAVAEYYARDLSEFNYSFTGS